MTKLLGGVRTVTDGGVRGRDKAATTGAGVDVEVAGPEVNTGGVICATEHDRIVGAALGD